MKSSLVFLSLFFNFLSFSQSIDSSQFDRVKVEKFDSLFPTTRIDVNSLEDYITANFVYPENEIQNIIDTVWVSFNVNINGILKDVTIFEGLTELIDEEAIRVIGVLPSFTFIPMEKDGEYVDQTFNYPIKVNGRGANKYNAKKVYDSSDLDVFPNYIGGIGELAVFIQ